MDYKGQHDAERLGQAIILVGFVVGTLYGWMVQSLLHALYGWCAGLGIALILCVPPWPLFCRHPIKWLPKKDNADDEDDDDDDKEEESGDAKTDPQVKQTASSSRFPINPKKKL